MIGDEITSIRIRKRVRDRVAHRAQWGQSLEQVIEEALDRAELCEAEHQPPRGSMGKTLANDRVLVGVS